MFNRKLILIILGALISIIALLVIGLPYFFEWRQEKLQKAAKEVHDKALSNPIEKFEDPPGNALLAKSKDFQIIYEANEDKFSIVITNKDYEKTRKIAEEYFVKEILKTGDLSVACQVKVFISTLGAFNSKVPPTSKLQACSTRSWSNFIKSAIAGHGGTNVWSTDADCQCADMTPYFGSRSYAARKIAARESACNPSAENDAENSIGLCQIDADAHCGRTYYCNNNQTTVTLSSSAGDGGTCQTQLKNATTNKIVACDLSDGSTTANPTTATTTYQGGRNWSIWGACSNTNANDAGHENFCSSPLAEDDGKNKPSWCATTLNVNSTGVSAVAISTGSGGQCGLQADDTGNPPSVCGGTTNYVESRRGRINVDLFFSSTLPKPSTLYYINTWSGCDTTKDWDDDGIFNICNVSLYGGITQTATANFVRSGEVRVSSTGDTTVSGFTGGTSGSPTGPTICTSPFVTHSGTCGTTPWQTHLPRNGFNKNIIAPATDPAGFTWNGWSGCDVGNGTGPSANKTCTVTVTNAQTQAVVANYAFIPNNCFVGSSCYASAPPDYTCGGAYGTCDGVCCVSPTPINPPAWIRLKDSSFNSLTEGAFTNLIPASPPRTIYDASDDTTPYFIIGTAGFGIFNNNYNFGAGEFSASDRVLSDYQKRTNMTPSIFLSYVRARVAHNITTTALTNLAANKINVIPQNSDGTKAKITISSTEHTQLIAQAPLSLIVEGDITISSPTPVFNPSPAASIALIATGKITFASGITEAHGIFVAGEGFDIGTTSNAGLKIVGNLVSFQPGFNNARSWNPNTKPSLFIQFYPKYYLDLAPYISSRYYGYNQLQ